MSTITTLARQRTEEHSTLQALSEEILRQQETKADYIVDTRRMSFTTLNESTEPWPGASLLTFDTPTGAALLHEPETPTEGTAGGPVNDYAHGQIGDRIGIPKKYYDRMRNQAPQLLDANVMHWFHHKPERRMVRMLDGRARAFLSDRYRRLDNLDLMERAVMPELTKHGTELVFHVAALTDTRLYVRALLPGLAEEITVGDVVQAGVEIRNSEVGAGALSVSPFIWRLVCLNGMVASDRSLRRYHVGRQQDEEAFAIYRDDTLDADDRAFFLKVRDAVGAALSDVTFGEIVKQMRKAATGEQTADPVLTTERLAKTYALDEGEQGSILRHLATGGDLTQWGAVNAITRAAKDADTFDRQAEMEAIGGQLVAVPAHHWATRLAA